jgi:hypothetical protein
MSPNFITTEHQLDTLLPKRRLEHSPPAELMAVARAWSDAVWAEAVRLGPVPVTEEQARRGTALANAPVYICGVHRSGTTLVRDLTDGHPELAVLPSEGTYYTNLEDQLLSLPVNKRAAYLGKEWLRRLANPINQPPYWLLGKSGEHGSPYVDFARYVLAWWEKVDRNNPQWPHLVTILAYAACTGKLSAKFWVDKTPANERHLRRIWKENPQAKIVHVIRDPLATLASRKRMEPGMTMRAALKDLKMSFKVAVEQSTLKDERFLLVRYEELCNDPQAVTERMASFLGIKNSEVLHQPTVAGIPSQANSSFNREAVSGEILKADQHPHVNILSKAERELIAADVGELAQKLGYPLEQVGFMKKLYYMLHKIS